MGYQDRPYFNDSNSGWRPGAGFGFGQMTITSRLITINVIIVLIDLLTATKQGNWLSDSMALQDNLLNKPWQVYQFLTYGFAHAPLNSKVGITHILGNMMTLFFLGRMLESKYGGREFLKIYMGGLLFAGVIWFLVHVSFANPLDPVSMYGASGAVSTILILFVLNYPREIILFFGAVPLPAWIVGAIALFGDLAHSFSSKSTIAGEAHLAGAGFAALYYYLGWNFAYLRWPAFLTGRPRLKVHNPRDDQRNLQEQVDRILAKITELGESSLTARERRTLEKLSRQLRERKQREAEQVRD